MLVKQCLCHFAEVIVGSQFSAAGLSSLTPDP